MKWGNHPAGGRLPRDVSQNDLELPSLRESGLSRFLRRSAGHGRPQTERPDFSRSGPRASASVPTIQRAICRGLIVPTFRTTSGRARFDRKYAEELKRRAEAARAHGAIRVLKARRALSRRRRASALAFARQTAWKRTHRSAEAGDATMLPRSKRLRSHANRFMGDRPKGFAAFDGSWNANVGGCWRFWPYREDREPERRKIRRRRKIAFLLPARATNNRQHFSALRDLPGSFMCPPRAHLPPAGAGAKHPALSRRGWFPAAISPCRRSL